MADSFFSLEIGESFIKLADVKKTGNLLEVYSLGFIPTHQEFYQTDIEKNIEIQANEINKLVSSNKITKKNVTIVIPDSYTFSQIFKMPQLNEKELISAIKYQADQFIPMPVEETNIDIEILEENNNEKRLTVLMVAAPKKLIEKIQTLSEMAGLIPESIENELSSTGRFLSEFKNLIQAKFGDNILIINLSRNSTSLYFYDANFSLIKETHSFSFGYGIFLKEIQINTNFDINKATEVLKTYDPKQKSSYEITSIISPALKEFLGEIKRFINLIAQKYNSHIKQIYLTNELFQFPGITYLIQKLLSLETEELNPYSICKSNPATLSHKDKISIFVSTIGANLR